MTTAYNVVRFRVRDGREGDFIDKHRKARPNFKGFRGGALIKTGDHTFCIIGERASFKALAEARRRCSRCSIVFARISRILGLGSASPIRSPLHHPKTVLR